MACRWKLRNPEKGYAAGHPDFPKQLMAGLLLDFIVTLSVPSVGLKAALSLDEGSPVADTHPMLDPPRAHLENLILYVGASAEDQIPLDGSHVTSAVVPLLPTSRGTVRLPSKNPADAPVIDPNYFATEVDRFVFHSGLRRIAKMLTDTKEGNAFIEKETPPTGLPPITPQSTDEELDERVRHSAQ